MVTWLLSAYCGPGPALSAGMQLSGVASATWLVTTSTPYCLWLCGKPVACPCPLHFGFPLCPTLPLPTTLPFRDPQHHLAMQFGSAPLPISLSLSYMTFLFIFLIAILVLPAVKVLLLQAVTQAIGPSFPCIQSSCWLCPGTGRKLGAACMTGSID